MSSYVIGSLIGAAAVLFGSMLTGVSEGRTRQAESDAGRTAELKLAMREYLAALDAITIEISDHPAASPQSWPDRK